MYCLNNSPMKKLNKFFSSMQSAYSVGLCMLGMTSSQYLVHIFDEMSYVSRIVSCCGCATFHLLNVHHIGKYGYSPTHL